MAAKPARRRLDPTKRRALILDEALRLFETNHFSTVSVRAIGDACGVNVALIYHYFDDKDHLVRAALNHAIDSFLSDFEALPSDADHPLGQAGTWLAANVCTATTVLRMVKLMNDYAASGNRDAEVDAAIAEFYSREREVLETALHDGIAQGRFRAVDVPRTARLASLALDGIFYGAASRADNRIAQHVTDLEAHLLDHLAPDLPA